MVVTLTRATLAARMRLGRESEELTEAENLLAYVTAAVTRHAPDAPDAVHDTAAWQLASYLYDRPFAGMGDRYANAMRNSGATSTLLPYRLHRAGVAAVVEETPEGSTDVLIQETPYTVTGQPTNIAASYGAGRYRAQVRGVGLVLYAAGAQPPADDSGYFEASLDGETRFFAFTAPGPVWVKTSSGTAVLAVARYAS